MQAGKLAKNLISFKRKLSKKIILDSFLKTKLNELKKLYGVKIEYFELRNLINLKISKKIKNSNFFIAYYINNVRLIDNF